MKEIILNILTFGLLFLIIFNIVSFDWAIWVVLGLSFIITQLDN